MFLFIFKLNSSLKLFLVTPCFTAATLVYCSSTSILYYLQSGNCFPYLQWYLCSSVRLLLVKYQFYHIRKGFKDFSWLPTQDQVQFPSLECKVNYSFNSALYYFSYNLLQSSLCYYYLHIKQSCVVNFLHQIATYNATSYSPF